MNLFAGQIIQAFDRRGGGSGDQQFFDARSQWIGEIDPLLPQGGNGQVGGRNIPAAFNQPGYQLIPTDGDEQNFELQRFGVELLVDKVYEKGATPIVSLKSAKVLRKIFKGTDEPIHLLP